MLNLKNAATILILIIALFSFLLNDSASVIFGKTNEPGFNTKLLSHLPQNGILNLTFKSKIDGSFQPLLVKLPRDYTPDKLWPLLVTLHGLGDGPILATNIESMVQIGPYGRGSIHFSGIGEQDVFECIEAAQNLFHIDENRIYLCGFSMGGTATFELGLKHPDIWAACVPVCGRCDNWDLIQNAAFLPFWIHTGEKDKVVSPEYSKKAFEKAVELGFTEWKYTEHEDMSHSFNINWKEVESWLLDKSKVIPKRVAFCTKTVHKVYWVEVTSIQDYGKLAKIDVAIKNQEINIVTHNISNYTLRLGEITDLSKEIHITENGVTAFKGHLGKDGIFAKNSRGHTVFKHPGLSGPLWDIYSNSCILVYGTTTTNSSLIEAAKRCAASFTNPPWMDRVNFKIVPDISITKKDIEENNLVLFGNAYTNKVLSQLVEKLPVQMNDDSIKIPKMEYFGKNIGYILIYPNPMNPKKYIAVFSGNRPSTIDCFKRIWPHLNSTPQNIDFGIFEFADDNDTVKWRLKTVLGSNWDWQD